MVRSLTSNETKRLQDRFPRRTIVQACYQDEVLVYTLGDKPQEDMPRKKLPKADNPTVSRQSEYMHGRKEKQTHSNRKLLMEED